MDVSALLCINSGWEAHEALSHCRSSLLHSFQSQGTKPSAAGPQCTADVNNHEDPGFVTRAKITILSKSINDPLPVILESKDIKTYTSRNTAPKCSAEGLGLGMDSASSLDDGQTLPVYSLHVVQQPKGVRVCGYGERDRDVIDPPPILEMRIQDPTDPTHMLAVDACNGFAVVHCTIWDPVSDTDCTAMPGPTNKRQQRRLVGSLISSPFVGNSEFGVTGSFLVFPDLSVRTTGTYQLCFKLVVLDPSRFGIAGTSTPVQSVVKSDLFRVFGGGDWTGTRENSALASCLRKQGLLISIKRRKAKSRRPNMDGPDGSKDEATFGHDVELPVVDVLSIIRDHLFTLDAENLGISKLSTLCSQRVRMPSHIMKEFWAIFDREWSANIREHAGPGSEVTSSAVFENPAGRRDTTTSGWKQPRGDGGDDGGGHDSDENEEPRRPRANPSSSMSTISAAKFACPYRKQNPEKYTHNNRQWRSCALSPFSDVARVKGHLYRHHRIYQCERCSEVFDKEEILSSHFLAVNSCGLRPQILVDGVTCSMEKRLKSRKKTSQTQSQEDRWREMYRLLFPSISMGTVPSSYFEPIHDDTSIPTADPFNLATYEAFSFHELPSIFAAALEATLRTNPDALESQLRDRLVAMVRESQVQVIARFRSRIVNNCTNTSTPAASNAAATPVVMLGERSRPRRQYRPARQRRSENRAPRRRRSFGQVEATSYATCLETENNKIQQLPSARDLGLPIFDSFNLAISGIEPSFDFSTSLEYQPEPYHQGFYPTSENATSFGIPCFDSFNDDFQYHSQNQNRTFDVQEDGRAN